MSAKSSLNLKEEELLCEKVRDYPVLYDKSHKGYKEKVAVENGWREVAESLDFVENGNLFCLSNLMCYCEAKETLSLLGRTCILTEI